MAMRYMRNDCKKLTAAVNWIHRIVDGNAKDTATVVSGENLYKFWDEEFVPTSEFSPEAVAAHENAMDGFS